MSGWRARSETFAFAVKLAVAFAVAFAGGFVVGGCGLKARDGLAPPSRPPVPRASATAPEAVEAPVVPTLDALAERQTRLAPGMRELARGETAAAVMLPRVDRDTCVRVVFAAEQDVGVSLVDRAGATLAHAKAAREGRLDEDGPVCFARDAEPRLEMEGDAGRVRYVVWAAP